MWEREGRDQERSMSQDSNLGNSAVQNIIFPHTAIADNIFI